MIVQGEKDSVVPIQMANWLIGNMTAMGTNVTYVVVPGGSHTFDIRDRVDQYVAFIEEHLPPYPPAPEETIPEEESTGYTGPFLSMKSLILLQHSMVQQMVLL